MYRYFKKIDCGDHISSWKSKGLSDESINPLATSNSIVTYFNYIGTKTRVKFEYQCLRQDEITLTDKKTVNIYTVYETNL